MSKAGDQIRMYLKLKGIGPVREDGSTLFNGPLEEVSRVDLGPLELRVMVYQWMYVENAAKVFGIDPGDVPVQYKDSTLFYTLFLPQNLPDNVIFVDWGEYNESQDLEYVMALFDVEVPE